MPLRDHFRAPLDRQSSWEGLYGGWPALVVADLDRALPSQFVAAPRVRLGGMAETNSAMYERDAGDPSQWTDGPSQGGVATAIWAPPSATLSIAADLPAQDEYEVRVYDVERGRRLVAAIEIVSPGNKDRPEHRHAFVAKCSALLQQQVSVVMVDLVTTRHFNLYHDLLELTGQSDPALGTEPPHLYAAACRSTRRSRNWNLDAWFHPLTLGAELPTLPLWLADDFAIPLNLESSYEETCHILRLPPASGGHVGKT